MEAQVQELEEIQLSINTSYTLLQDKFCTTRAEFIVRDKIDWENMDYTQSTIQDYEAGPSTKFLKFCEFANGLVSTIRTFLGKQYIMPITSKLINSIIQNLDKYGKWTKIGSRFAAGGIQQINIDIKFLSIVFSKCISTSGEETLKKIIANAVVAYAKESKAKTRKNILNDDDWVDKCLKRAIDNQRTFMNELNSAD